MKLIQSLVGFVAVRFAPEDVVPSDRLPRPRLLEELLTRYQFVGRGDPNMQPILFQNGVASIDNKGIAFNELQVFNGEIVCQAEDTEVANLIANDLFRHFDEKFGYKFTRVTMRRTFVSSVIVEFERNMDNLISTTHLLEKLINSSCPGERNLKRLSFGLKENESGAGQAVTPFDTASSADFFIERRLGSDPEINRFFCSAPMRTPQHLALLEAFEKVGAAQKRPAKTR